MPLLALFKQLTHLLPLFQLPEVVAGHELPHAELGHGRGGLLRERPAEGGAAQAHGGQDRVHHDAHGLEDLGRHGLGQPLELGGGQGLDVQQQVRLQRLLAPALQPAQLRLQARDLGAQLAQVGLRVHLQLLPGLQRQPDRARHLGRGYIRGLFVRVGVLWSCCIPFQCCSPWSRKYSAFQRFLQGHPVLGVAKHVPRELKLKHQVCQVLPSGDGLRLEAPLVQRAEQPHDRVAHRRLDVLRGGLHEPRDGLPGAQPPHHVHVVVQLRRHLPIHIEFGVARAIV
mmetsp:Transcript_14730/g.26255  ORF Transcript_14730/g.26255 Transcript_14730/m.26255 type:complete len:284 (-) Transcript_14730:40-891(-)